MIDNFNQEILTDLKELLQIKSLLDKAEKDAPFGKELRTTLDWFLNKAKSYGLDCGDMEGYCGYCEYGNSSNMIGILCHLDTVPAGGDWKFEPYDLTVKDDTLYGRGIVDNKGPAVVILHILKALKENNVKLNHRIRLIVGLNEETGSECLKHYLKHGEIPKFSIVPDADFPCVNSEKGILHLNLKIPVTKEFKNTVKSIGFGTRANVVPDKAAVVFKDGTDKEFKGVAGHAMNPNDADNAAHKLFKELSKDFDECKTIYDLLCSHDAKNNLELDLKDKQSGELTLNLAVGKFDGNDIDLTLDFRLPLCANKDTVIKKLKDKLTDNIKTLHYQPNLYIDIDTPLVQTLLKIYKASTGQNLSFKKCRLSPSPKMATRCLRQIDNCKFRCKDLIDISPIQTGGGTYARLLPNAIAFGPTFPNIKTNIHNTDENISLKNFKKWYNIYYEAILELDKL